MQIVIDRITLWNIHETYIQILRLLKEIFAKYDR